MTAKIIREKVDRDMFTLLKTIFHYERILSVQYGLDFVEMYALQFLRQNPSARVTDLSTELKLPMFTISRLVQRLVAGGFLTREKDAVDKRNIHLHLEPSGEKVLAQIESTNFERITANLGAFSDPEKTELLNLADKLHIVLGVSEHVITKA
jgi:DNA-binding MarR family transcriptional regulator